MAPQEPVIDTGASTRIFGTHWSADSSDGTTVGKKRFCYNGN